MDLFHVTQYVCLPIIIGILTLAFPILLQTISRIDEKYNTSVLTKRFKEEKTYKCFNWTLYFSLAYLLYHFIVSRHIVWTFNWDTLLDDFLNISSSLFLIGCTITLVISLIKLIQRIMVYYDHSELLVDEIKKFEGFKKMNMNEFEVFIFILNYNICLKDDLSEKNARKVYNFLAKYTRKRYKKEKEFHNRFYLIIEQLNEKLCQQDRKLTPIHNTNEILCILLPFESKAKDIVISQNTYNWLFIAFHTQLDYNKIDWIYIYWEIASQYYTGKNNNEEFKEFHLWLATMVLYKEEYGLLDKILSYTQHKPARFPLVPSSFSEILTSFIKINTVTKQKPEFSPAYFFIKKTSMRCFDEYQELVNKYHVLLLLRLNSYDVAMMDWRGGWNEPKLPNELRELENWKERIKELQCCVKKWTKNREHPAFKTFMIDAEQEAANNPLEKLDELIKDTEEAIVNERYYKNLDNTPKFYDFTKETIEENIYYLKNFTRRRKGKNSDAEKLSNNRTMIFVNRAFTGAASPQQKKAIKLLPCISAKRMQEQFSLSFLSSRNIKEKTNYFFFAENAFKAIDKLAPIKKDFIIVNFGVELSKFICNNNSEINGLISSNSREYKFMNMDILSFMENIHPCISKTLVIIPKNKLPYIEEEQPTKKEMDKYFFDETSHLNKMLGIYASITNENDTNRNSIDQFCTAYLSYRYNIYWERDTELAVIKVLDENNNYTIPSNLEDVTRLPLPKRIKNIGNMQQRIHWGLKEAGSRWGRPVYERK